MFNSEMEVYVSDQYFGNLVKIEAVSEEVPEFVMGEFLIKSPDKMKIRVITDVGSVLISRFNYYKGPEGERLYIPEEWVLNKPNITASPSGTAVGITGTIWSKDWQPSSWEEKVGPAVSTELDTLKELFPGVKEGAKCPIPEQDDCGLAEDDYRDHVYNIVMHLNDHHMWSREEIADWLESLDIDLDIAID